MAIKSLVICDSCNTDISGRDYRLTLKAERSNTTSWAYINMPLPHHYGYRKPLEVNEEKHFCNHECLSTWVETFMKGA